MTFVGWAAAIALSTVACGSSNKYPAGDASRAGQPAASGAAAGSAGSTTASDQQKSPVTLVGCLQKGDGRSDFILTEVNAPRTPVGTSGSATAVGQEQMRAAAHAYRLSGERDRLEPLVGREVRVSGSLTERSDLNDHTKEGTVKEKDRTTIDESDLAKVDVASVEQVADSCGTKSPSK